MIKKIGTMTFHIAHNYGAMLQAYALVTAISQFGYECEVIDYRFPYIDQWSGIHTKDEIIQEYGQIKGSLIALKRKYTNYRVITPARRKFDDFMRNKIRLSKRTYYHKEDLTNADYDVVLFGSDQIWNPNLTDGYALEYMGQQFDISHTSLISYAASCGLDHFKEEWRDTYYPLLKRFSSISVREKGLADYINQSYQLKAEAVMDPVFLLSKETWSTLAEEADITINEPYMLVYAFEVGNDIYDLARRIAEERGLKLVTIGYQEQDELNDMVQLLECGPIDFLSLIVNAGFVCTTSFHGMAFSILFEKDFYCIGHPKYSARNRELLKTMGMEDRMIKCADDVKDIRTLVYSSLRNTLKEEVDKSSLFIQHALEKAGIYAD